MRRMLQALLLMPVLLSLAAPLQAQEQTASPDNLQKPLAAFLSATDWKNAEKLAASTRYWQLLDHIFLIRVVDKTTCDESEDLCLTIIGSMRSGGFVAEAVFYAGGKVRMSDSTLALGGADGPSLFYVRFFGKKQEVIAAPAPTGWIIIPKPIAEPDKN